ncbi:phosphotransferase [Paenibacillus sp. LHD-117]|uniref:phosphotransferase n=1 Tax=Paenibacillus sp. LHD-117 TaxID=3071412 RepID=UPI0027E1DD11|nr:phosphotransferase [Paenibacillus sp. LHD-117]MDQ6418054.1 phosphotransferase [Paenibacillus sp. LHD-117]
MTSIEEQIEAALGRYRWQAPCIAEAGASGMNNTTRIVSSGEKKYVLRIYNNHGDADTVRFEHDMLKALTREKLDFQVPEPVPNKAGDSVTMLEDGKLACVFRYIEGVRPTPENSAHVSSLGAATGKLCKVLSGVKLDRMPQYSAYYELGQTYAAMDKPSFLGLANMSEYLREQAQQFGYLQNERETVLRACEDVAGLPRQWIHGDICFGNALSTGDRIAGILDFEFVTVDSRAMELAVLMVDLLKREIAAGSSEKLALVADAFLSIVELTAEERKLLPTLMKLRLLDVALHFALRFREGLDGPEVLSGIVDSSAYGCEWIAKHKPVY